jgi:hypothetical protein
MALNPIFAEALAPFTRKVPRYFVSMYTDGPSKSWNVIDRQTQEWVRRFPTEQEAREHAAALSLPLQHQVKP